MKLRSKISWFYIRYVTVSLSVIYIKFKSQNFVVLHPLRNGFNYEIIILFLSQEFVLRTKVNFQMP